MWKLNNYRKDVKDISNHEVIVIKDRELLIIELEHNNKILQGKEKAVNSLTLLFISGIIILAFGMLKELKLLFNYANEVGVEDINNLITNFPIIIDIGFYISFTAIIILLFIVVSGLKCRGAIIDRKNLILNEIKKLSRVKKYNKT